MDWIRTVSIMYNTLDTNTDMYLYEINKYHVIINFPPVNVLLYRLRLVKINQQLLAVSWGEIWYTQIL